MDERTVLNDKIRFIMPLGILGELVGKFVIVPYLSRRLRRRLVLLRKVAQNNKEWRKYLPKDYEST
jgi:ligand-binding SRPBCC domain-containing protein